MKKAFFSIAIIFCFLNTLHADINTRFTNNVYSEFGGNINSYNNLINGLNNNWTDGIMMQADCLSAVNMFGNSIGNSQLRQFSIGINFIPFESDKTFTNQTLNGVKQFCYLNSYSFQFLGGFGFLEKFNFVFSAGFFGKMHTKPPAINGFNFSTKFHWNFLTLMFNENIGFEGFHLIVGIGFLYQDYEEYKPFDIASGYLPMFGDTLLYFDNSNGSIYFTNLNIKLKIFNFSPSLELAFFFRIYFVTIFFSSGMVLSVSDVKVNISSNVNIKYFPTGTPAGIDSVMIIDGKISKVHVIPFIYLGLSFNIKKTVRIPIFFQIKWIQNERSAFFNLGIGVRLDF